MVLARRTMATAPAGLMSQSPTKADLVNVATLVRGRVYFYKDLKFEYGVPQVVSVDVASVLENEVAEVKDKDGERFEKPFFRVQYDVQRPEKQLTEAERNRKPIRRLDPAAVQRRG